MIVGFKDRRLEAIHGERTPKRFPPQLLQRVRTLLAVIEDASALSELLEPPGNRLEALQGDRAGQHSLRVNRQFRICFTWTENGAAEIEMVDYH